MQQRYYLEQRIIRKDRVRDSICHKYLSEEEVVDRLNNFYERNKELKHNRLRGLAFSRWGGFSINREDGKYYIYSDNITPKNHPIIKIESPQTIWNEYIAEYIWDIIKRTSGDESE